MSLGAEPASQLLLRKLEAFTPEERAGLIQLPVRVKTIAAGNDVVQEGVISKNSLVVLDGWLCRYKALSADDRQALSVHIPGDVPDLLSLHLPRMDRSVAALTHCTVGLLPHESLNALCMEFPRIAIAL